MFLTEIITTVEDDTRKYSKFIAGMAYECEARYHSKQYVKEWSFLGITFYCGNTENANKDWSCVKPRPLVTNQNRLPEHSDIREAMDKREEQSD